MSSNSPRLTRYRATARRPWLRPAPSSTPVFSQVTGVGWVLRGNTHTTRCVTGGPRSRRGRLPGVGRQRRARAPGNWGKSRKDRRGRSGAGQEGRMRLKLRVDPIGPVALVGLEGLDGAAGLLHRAGHEPADGVLLPAHLGHEFRQRGTALALQHRHNLGCLRALTRTGGLLRLRGFLALGAFLAAVVFLVALAFVGAPLAPCAPLLAFLPAFGFATAAFGLAASPRLWMRVQRAEEHRV